MNLATFTRGTHRPTCSGCPACNEQYRWLLYEASHEEQIEFRNDRDGAPPRALSSVPEPPSLFDAIRAAAPTRQARMAAVWNAPRPFSDPTPTTAEAGYADAPPDLVTLMQRSKK